MTVRGFLAWYLGTVAMVGASGAVMWHGIQERKHVETAAVAVPQAAEAPVQAMDVAEAQPEQPVADQSQATVPKLQPHLSQPASLPLPPLRTAPPATHTTRLASGAIHSAKPRPVAKAAARTPTYQNPPLAAGPYPYPGYTAGYVVAYPPGGVAPWQMQPYPAYYQQRRYYMRYPY